MHHFLVRDEMTENQHRPPLAILRRPQVEARTGMGTSLIYALMARGEFPRPIKLTAKAVGWPEHIVEAWIAARIERTS
jgi:prophage regulatory protein